MRLSCDVVKDLMPLFVEGMLSEKSVDLVEEHLEGCEDCRQFLNQFDENKEIPEDRNLMPILKLKSSLRKKKAVVIALTITFTLLFSAVLFSFLSAPNYIPLSEELLDVSELNDGSVIVQFNQPVHGYDIDESPSDSGEGSVYHMTAWRTSLGDAGLEAEVDRIVLTNNEEEAVSSVYYYQTDGSLDRLIYGRDENPNGGSLILPRLNLSYYLLAAGLLMLVSLIALVAFRRNKKVVNLLLVVLLLPLAYMIAHMIVTGVTAASYQSTRDLLAILSITIPLSAFMYLGLVSYNIKKERQTIKRNNTNTDV